MLAGRAPIGGEREMVLAALVAARLASGILKPNSLSAAARQSRAAGARVWFSTLTLPSATRAPLAKLVEATEGENSATVAETLSAFVGLAWPQLDIAARGEIGELVTSLKTG
jgi:hypothetical protein